MSSRAESEPSSGGDADDGTLPRDDGALFDLPRDARVPSRRVILLAGASGSGKSSVARALGIPVARLDDFYYDHDEPGLPRSRGIVDWDDAATWNAAAAVEALAAACFGDRLMAPTYSIPLSRRTGQETIDVSGAPALLAEGIFAAEIAQALRERGLLAGGYYLQQSRHLTAVRRFARDIGENRKPPLDLLRRGAALWSAEPAMVRTWRGCGLEPLQRQGAEDRLARLISR